MNKPSAADSTYSLPLSVVMPAYNEQENITAAVGEVQSKVLSLVPNAELIVVNDGSRDETGALLEKIAVQDARIVVINKTNAGHGPALIAGMKCARGEYIFLIDSDMQIPLDCFAEVWRNGQTCDAVFGIRRRRQDPLLRLWLSTLIKAATLVIFGVKAPDINAPCKLFRRAVWENFRSAIASDDLLAPSLMINIFVRAHHYNVCEMAVAHRARTGGKTSLNLQRLIPFALSGLGQLMQYRSRLL